MKHKDLIQRMTLEEKAAILSGKSVWETREVRRLGIPSIFLSDGPHGLRKQAAAGDHLGLNESLSATCFPTAATIANSWNCALAGEIGEALGAEAVSMDVDVLLEVLYAEEILNIFPKIRICQGKWQPPMYGESRKKAFIPA